MTGSSGLPEEPPAVSTLPGEVPDSAGSVGTSLESAGAVRSWPDADSRAGEALRPDRAPRSEAAQAAGTSPRRSAGLSAVLLPELQRPPPAVGHLCAGPEAPSPVHAPLR